YEAWGVAFAPCAAHVLAPGTSWKPSALRVCRARLIPRARHTVGLRQRIWVPCRSRADLSLRFVAEHPDVDGDEQRDRDGGPDRRDGDAGVVDEEPDGEGDQRGEESGAQRGEAVEGALQRT